MPLLHRLLAMLLLAHVVAILALAASPRLHHWVHQHADDDDDCAVVLYLHGGCDHPPAAVPLPAILLAAESSSQPTLLRVAGVPSIFAGNRVFEHAPPTV